MPVFDRFTLHQRHFLSLNDFENPNVPDQYPPDLELEPIHLDIDLHVDVAQETASGQVTATVRARHDGPRVLKLNAVDCLDVSVSDVGGRELIWRYDGQVISIHWTEPFQAGESRRASVAYHVHKPVDGLYFSRPDEAYPDRPWYAATDHETERARHWLPCVDLPNVRTPLDIRLRADERFTILANGLLVSETVHDDGTKTAHWKLEQLCPSYLICFAIGDFVRAPDGSFNDGEKEIELAYFCSHDHDGPSLLRSFGRTRPMMTWMTKKLNRPFPFPKYYQFALPLMGGAMENISLVSWTDWAVADELMAQDMGWYIDLINVHEMAHSYFGDAVVCRDFAHAWLKESWATYMEQCWLEDEGSLDERQYLYYTDALAYIKEADEEYKRPIVTRRFKSSWQLYDRHLYPGGACRIHTLRRELGDDVFWAAVHDYLERYDGRVVETDHFRHVMEEHSGRSLGKFFDQWFHSPGYPDIKVSFEYDDEEGQGTFVIEQRQADPDKGIPVFALSTDVSWILDGAEHIWPVHFDQAKHVITVPMATEPEQVRFDPRGKVLHKLELNPGDTLLRRQLKEARDVIGRIQAGHELAKTGKRANIEAIIEAYAQEPFWGVREQFAEALAGSNVDAAIDGLARFVSAEKEPKALISVFRAAEKYRDRRIQEAIGQRLREELPHSARSAGYQAMGAQRRQADWELLEAGSRQPGHNGIAQSGAFRGLAATRRSEAVKLLLEQIGYGHISNRVRPEMVTALADIGQGLEKAERERVVETLTDLLRDPWMWVRMTAAAGLAKMKAIEAIPALEAYGRSLSQQGRVRVEQLVESMRDADKSDGSAVKKQVEDLRDQVRRLEDRLQKLAAVVEAAKNDE